MNVLFEKFAIIDYLKKDDFTSVYRAKVLASGQKIILKTLNTENLPDATVQKRFRREAKILAGLDHPHIVKALDFGAYEDYLFISFEYVEGENLRQFLKNSKPAGCPKLRLFVQLLQGLAYAHRLGVIHRDIKPENLLIDRSLSLKIADFGLARLQSEEQVTHKASIVGTPGYMSPEQIRGETLTSASDLFSAGVVGLEMFSGENPFLGGDVGTTINNILSKDIGETISRLPAETPELRGLLKALLQKQASNRPASAEAALKLLPAEIAEPAWTAVSAPAAPVFSPRRLLTGGSMIAAVLLFLWLLGNPWAATVNDPQKANSPAPEPLTAGIMDSLSGTETSSGAFVERPVAEPPLNQTAVENDLPAASNAAKTKTVDTPPAEADISPGQLYIQCLPWADVWIGDRRMDTTPLQKPLELLPGSYNVRLQHPNYPAYEREITVRSAQRIAISVDLDTLFGYLDCLVYPWGEIFINGVSKGITPLDAPLMLPNGTHQLRIVNPQLPPFEKQISIIRRNTLTYQVDLEKNVWEMSNQPPASNGGAAKP